MAVWILWAGRVAAALVLLLVSLAFLLVGLMTPDGKILGFSVAAVTALAAWASWPRTPNSWRGDPPTERQLEFAANLGIDVPAGATKGQVSDLISAVTGR
jgi:hypothetical protein